MPYVSENIPLTREQDRRVKLSDEQRKEIREKYAEGLYSQRKLAAEYGISRRLVCFIVHPEKEIKCREQYKERRKDGRYKETKEKRAALQRNLRRYKQELYLKGELVKVTEQSAE